MDIIDIGYLASFYVMLYCSFIWIYVYLSNRGKIMKNPLPEKKPLVSFIVSAYNERNNIGNCIKAIRKIRYPRKEIIVVNDGSTDDTEKICRKYQRMGIVKLVNQKHAGKATAMNNGIKYAKGGFIASMDADSYPEPDYLDNMMGYFNDPDVSVVTPSLKALQTDSVIRKIQWVEYLFQIFLRKVFSIFDCQYVAPGPGSVYRAGVLRDIGGFATDTMTEDMELAFRLHSHGHKIENSANAYVYTNVPKKFGGLYKQRIRWYRGYLQNTRKYSHMIFKIKYGNLGFFLMPTNLIWIGIMTFMFLASLRGIILGLYNFVKPAILLNDAGAIFSLNQLKFDWFYIFDFYSFFTVLFLAIGSLTILIAVMISGEGLEIRKRSVFYLYFFILYPVLLYFFWIVSTIKELKGDRNVW